VALQGKVTGYDAALQKIRAYCAYQERPHKDVQHKLYSYGLRSADVDAITAQLVTEGFLNEERFARTFSGGKFRINKWGKVKIAQALEAKGLTNNCIRSGLSEIDNADYRKTLQILLRKKEEQLVSTDAFQRRGKLATYGVQRGYEPDLVWEIVDQILPG
jgi:regulatory protein